MQMDEVMEKPARSKALKQYKITFHNGDGDDSGDVVIGHNYKLNQYKRNVETTIDENFLGALKDAVIYTTVKSEDGKVTNITIPRFSYTVNPA